MDLTIRDLTWEIDGSFGQGTREKLLSIGYSPLLQGCIKVGDQNIASVLVVHLISSGDVLVQVAIGDVMQPQKLDDDWVETLREIVFQAILPSHRIDFEHQTLFWDIVSPSSPQWYV